MIDTISVNNDILIGRYGIFQKVYISLLADTLLKSDGKMKSLFIMAYASIVLVPPICVYVIPLLEACRATVQHISLGSSFPTCHSCHIFFYKKRDSDSVTYFFIYY